MPSIVLTPCSLTYIYRMSNPFSDQKQVAIKAAVNDVFLWTSVLSSWHSLGVQQSRGLQGRDIGYGSYISETQCLCRSGSCPVHCVVGQVFTSHLRTPCHTPSPFGSQSNLCKTQVTLCNLILKILLWPPTVFIESPDNLA